MSAHIAGNTTQNWFMYLKSQFLCLSVLGGRVLSVPLVVWPGVWRPLSS